MPGPRSTSPATAGWPFEPTPVARPAPAAEDYAADPAVSGPDRGRPPRNRDHSRHHDHSARRTRARRTATSQDLDAGSGESTALVRPGAVVAATRS